MDDKHGRPIVRELDEGDPWEDDQRDYAEEAYNRDEALREAIAEDVAEDAALAEADRIYDERTMDADVRSTDNPPLHGTGY